jgi:flagella basal body P-ring formation protein FlgA
MLRALFLAMLVVAAMHAECIQVDGARITAADLAKASAAFEKADPSLVFSFAPSFGTQRIISPMELERWASSHGFSATVSSPACFERASHDLQQDQVIGAVKAAIGPGVDDLRVDVVETCQCRVPAGKLEFELAHTSLPPIDHPETPVLWRGRLIATDGGVYPVWARVRVVAAVTVVRATRNLRTRQLLAAEDLEFDRTVDSPLRFPQPVSIAAYVGKSMNFSISRGASIDPTMVHSPSDVERGSLVTVEVLNGAARLVLIAQADTAGNRGDLVTLTNPAGAARFHATVTGPGRAELALPLERFQNAEAVRESQPAVGISKGSF